MAIPLNCFICILFLASSFDWICHDQRPCLSCEALSSTSTSTIPTTKLTSVGRSQFAVLDGAEWDSVKSLLLDEQRQPSQSPSTTSSPRSKKYGYMNVVTGKDENNCRIVAMQCIDSYGSQASSVVYEDSVAIIPNQVSDEDAISTYIASFSVIHSAFPRFKIGGGNEFSEAISTGKVVVLGSGDLACFSAEGLASLGMEVFLVNNKWINNVRKNLGKLTVIKPTVGESELGFASYVGEFDSLVDTIGNERSLGSDDDEGMMSLGESTLQMLKSRHKCYNYVSTLTHSQNIIVEEGLIGGPRKADDYCEKVGNLAFITKSSVSQSVIPPRYIGSALETLMKNGVLFTEGQRSKACSENSDAVRGWSLSDFWEQVSWPRDSSGTGTTRFGLPVREDSEIGDEDEYMISGALDEDLKSNRRVNRDDYDDNSSSSAPSSSNAENRVIENNPFVLNVMDIDGFESEIVDTKKNCIMFMSAKFCKTCKTINPAYNRMARMKQENDSTINCVFAKAETSGASGKALAKRLSVRAVPSFVFVREGKILGSTYVSKLPSPKVDKAMQLLASGADWDYSLSDDN